MAPYVSIVMLNPVPVILSAAKNLVLSAWDKLREESCLFKYETLHSVQGDTII